MMSPPPIEIDAETKAQCKANFIEALTPNYTEREAIMCAEFYLWGLEVGINGYRKGLANGFVTDEELQWRKLNRPRWRVIWDRLWRR